jgi:putative SbcD/Mre11-related phosphoesterase
VLPDSSAGRNETMYNVQIFPGVKITNDLCLWMEERGTMAIADLHIGLEAALEQTGVHIPRIQSASMKESLIRILDRYEPDTILILGDLKHEFSGNLDQEWRDVSDILSMLRDSATVKIAKGNHDNYLANISQRLGIVVADSFEIDGIAFMHGHAPSAHRPLVIGHEHPSVRIFDRVGAYLKLPSFLHFENEQILVLPAFSPLAGGTDFTNLGRADTMSPALKEADIEDAKVYACTEIGLLALGTIRDLGRIKTY